MSMDVRRRGFSPLDNYVNVYTNVASEANRSAQYVNATTYNPLTRLPQFDSTMGPDRMVRQINFTQKNEDFILSSYYGIDAGLSPTRRSQALHIGVNRTLFPETSNVLGDPGTHISYGPSFKQQELYEDIYGSPPPTMWNSNDVYNATGGVTGFETRYPGLVPLGTDVFFNDKRGMWESKIDNRYWVFENNQWVELGGGGGRFSRHGGGGGGHTPYTPKSPYDYYNRLFKELRYDLTYEVWKETMGAYFNATRTEGYYANEPYKRSYAPPSIFTHTTPEETYGLEPTLATIAEIVGLSGFQGTGQGLAGALKWGGAPQMEVASASLRQLEFIAALNPWSRVGPAFLGGVGEQFYRGGFLASAQGDQYTFAVLAEQRFDWAMQASTMSGQQTNLARAGYYMGQQATSALALGWYSMQAASYANPDYYGLRLWGWLGMGAIRGETAAFLESSSLKRAYQANQQATIQAISSPGVLNYGYGIPSPENALSQNIGEWGFGFGLGTALSDSRAFKSYGGVAGLVGTGLEMAGAALGLSTGLSLLNRALVGIPLTSQEKTSAAINLGAAAALFGGGMFANWAGGNPLIAGFGGAGFRGGLGVNIVTETSRELNWEVGLAGRAIVGTISETRVLESARFPGNGMSLYTGGYEFVAGNGSLATTITDYVGLGTELPEGIADPVLSKMAAMGLTRMGTMGIDVENGVTGTMNMGWMPSVRGVLQENLDNFELTGIYSSDPEVAMNQVIEQVSKRSLTGGGGTSGWSVGGLIGGYLGGTLASLAYQQYGANWVQQQYGQNISMVGNVVTTLTGTVAGSYLGSKLLQPLIKLALGDIKIAGGATGIFGGIGGGILGATIAGAAMNYATPALRNMGLSNQQISNIGIVAGVAGGLGGSLLTGAALAADAASLTFDLGLAASGIGIGIAAAEALTAIQEYNIRETLINAPNAMSLRTFTPFQSQISIPQTNLMGGPRAQTGMSYLGLTLQYEQALSKGFQAESFNPQTPPEYSYSSATRYIYDYNGTNGIVGQIASFKYGPYNNWVGPDVYLTPGERINATLGHIEGQLHISGPPKKTAWTQWVSATPSTYFDGYSGLALEFSLSGIGTPTFNENVGVVGIHLLSPTKFGAYVQMEPGDIAEIITTAGLKAASDIRTNAINYIDTLKAQAGADATFYKNLVGADMREAGLKPSWLTSLIYSVALPELFSKYESTLLGTQSPNSPIAKDLKTFISTISHTPLGGVNFYAAQSYLYATTNFGVIGPSGYAQYPDIATLTEALNVRGLTTTWGGGFNVPSQGPVGGMNYGYGPGTLTSYGTGGKDAETGLNWPEAGGINRLPGTVNGIYIQGDPNFVLGVQNGQSMVTNFTPGSTYGQTFVAPTVINPQQWYNNMAAHGMYVPGTITDLVGQLAGDYFKMAMGQTRMNPNLRAGYQAETSMFNWELQTFNQFGDIAVSPGGPLLSSFPIGISKTSGTIPENLSKVMTQSQWDKIVSAGGNYSVDPWGGIHVGTYNQLTGQWSNELNGYVTGGSPGMSTTGYFKTEGVSATAQANNPDKYYDPASHSWKAIPAGLVSRYGPTTARWLALHRPTHLSLTGGGGIIVGPAVDYSNEGGQYGFEGIISTPTTFAVAEEGKAEFVHVTPMPRGSIPGPHLWHVLKRRINEYDSDDKRTPSPTEMVTEQEDKTKVTIAQTKRLIVDTVAHLIKSGELQGHPSTWDEEMKQATVNSIYTRLALTITDKQSRGQ